MPATSVSIRVREVGRPGRRALLLVVHDGPEYVRRGSLLRLLNRLVEARELPAHRVALLAPADRMETYSASARSRCSTPTGSSRAPSPVSSCSRAAVDFHAARGGHEWPAWRRALAAHLAPLLLRAWR